MNGNDWIIQIILTFQRGQNQLQGLLEWRENRGPKD